MAIIGTLPNNIQNGQSVDANPVMADFNFIVNQVNANANPLGTLTAPSGTTTLFYQAAAPAGWTISAGFTDHTIQVNAAAGGTTGGAANYSTMFQAQWSDDAHSITIAEMPTHTHTATDSGHSHGLTYDRSATFGTAASPLEGTNTAPQAVATQAGFANITIGAQGSGVGHSHTKTFNALYVAMIMAVKT